jgi:hypothetical protein
LDPPDGGGFFQHVEDRLWGGENSTRNACPLEAMLGVLSDHCVADFVSDVFESHLSESALHGGLGGERMESVWQVVQKKPLRKKRPQLSQFRQLHWQLGGDNYRAKELPAG